MNNNNARGDLRGPKIDLKSAKNEPFHPSKFENFALQARATVCFRIDFGLVGTSVVNFPILEVDHVSTAFCSTMFLTLRLSSEHLNNVKELANSKLTL